jgi:uncharacterized protein YndB with AHSA1/START domain
MDVRPGGSYRFAMQPPEGEVFHLEGEFVAVDPPALLSYTFRWEPPDPDDQETLVTLAFEEAGPEATKVRFTQGEFRTEARRACTRRAGRTRSRSSAASCPGAAWT